MNVANNTAILSPFSKIIILTLYGEKYAEAANVLIIHIWTCLFVFLGIASSTWYAAENLQKFILPNTIAGAVVNIFLNMYIFYIHIFFSFFLFLFFVNLSYISFFLFFNFSALLQE